MLFFLFSCLVGSVLSYELITLLALDEKQLLLPDSQKRLSEEIKKYKSSDSKSLLWPFLKIRARVVTEADLACFKIVLDFLCKNNILDNEQKLRLIKAWVQQIKQHRNTALMGSRCLALQILESAIDYANEKICLRSYESGIWSSIRKRVMTLNSTPATRP